MNQAFKVILISVTGIQNGVLS